MTAVATAQGSETVAKASPWRRALDDAYDCCRAAGLSHDQALEMSEAALMVSCAAMPVGVAADAVARTLACTQDMLRQRM